MNRKRLRANFDAAVWYAGQYPFKYVLELAAITAMFGGIAWVLYHV